MYKVTFELQTSFGVATQVLFFLNLPEQSMLTKIMRDLVMEDITLDALYTVGLWETVRFQTDSRYSGRILVEKVKACDIAQ